MSKEFNDFLEFFLRLIDTGNVLKCDRTLTLAHLGPGFAKRPDLVAHLRAAVREKPDEHDNKKYRHEREEHLAPEDLRGDDFKILDIFPDGL